MCEEAWLDETSARPGRWKPELVPWAREIIDGLDPGSPVRRIVVMKSGQASITTIMVLVSAYLIAEAPRSFALIWPTLDLVRANFKQRLQPLYQAIPTLSNLFDFSIRSSDLTATQLTFSGGIGYLKPGNRRGLVNFSAPYLLLDEVSKFQAAADGDSLVRARRACITYPDAKIFEASTPDDIGSCPLVAAHSEGDCRVYRVPCPACGHEQELTWDRVQYPEGKPEEAVIVCTAPGCGHRMTEREKPGMLAKGKWYVTEPAGRHRSYHVSGFMSQLMTWAAIAMEYENCRGDYQREIVWRKEWLGLPALPVGGAVLSPDQLLSRVETSLALGHCPDRALILTAGVDVQGNRIECYVFGWADQRECWLVDIQIIEGNPGKRAVWDQLQDVLDHMYPTLRTGDRGISLACIDTGYLTESVYEFAGRWQRARLIKGRSETTGQAIFKPVRMDLTRKGRRIRGGVNVTGINTDLFKEAFMTGLKAQPGDRGYFHLPPVRREVAAGLLGEEQTLEVTRTGQKKWVWKRVRGRRNEPLDCHVYAAAAFQILGLHRWKAARWEKLEAEPRPRLSVDAMPVRTKIEPVAPSNPFAASRWK